MGTHPSLGRSCRPAQPEASFCDSEPLDVAVGLQRGKEYVEKPQAHKEPDVTEATYDTCVAERIQTFELNKKAPKIPFLFFAL